MFYVALGDTLFEYQSFLDALDASFKYFKVFKIDFPQESTKFWKLIDAASVINSFQPDTE